MKNRYAFGSILVMGMYSCLPTKAQNYQPFTPDSRKLFATTDHSTTFGIAFDSTTVSGGITTYHNYKTVWDTLTPSNCGWWGGQECNKQDRPTWAGPRIEVVADGTHTLFNLWNEPITLAFSTEPGSQTLMYADGSQQFLLSYVGESPLEVLGLTENMRQWTILHEDLNGNALSSPLNNSAVLVGETVGLIRYFRIDSFPNVLQPVELVGQAEPPLGVHAITPAFLNDYQPGDVIQVHDYANYYTGPPWLDENVYRKAVILSRTDTPNEVTYELEGTTYNVDSATETTGLSIVTYSKTNVIVAIPFDRFDGTQPWLGIRGYCGIPLWTYRTFANMGLGYCPDENCWGPYDTNGPPPSGGTTMVGGLGTYSSWSNLISPSGYNTSHDVVYFKKNGQECGQEIVMGIPTIGGAPTLTLWPVPTDGLLSINATQAMKAITLRDASGRMVLQATLQGQIGKLDLGSLSQGLYLAEVLFSSGDRATSRVLVSAR